LLLIRIKGFSKPGSYIEKLIGTQSFKGEKIIMYSARLNQNDRLLFYIKDGKITIVNPNSDHYKEIK
jgi:Txe/YoeB family toxin of Txe-Axe toxin-antitoxin module